MSVTSGDSKNSISVNKKSAALIWKGEGEKKNPKTLQELTGQASGIVVYGEDVLVLNWADKCPSGGLPATDILGSMIVPYPHSLKVTKKYKVSDVRSALPGEIVEMGSQVLVENMHILHDDNNEILGLWGYRISKKNELLVESTIVTPTSGTCYQIGSALVIAPDEWI